MDECAFDLLPKMFTWDDLMIGVRGVVVEGPSDGKSRDMRGARQCEVLVGIDGVHSPLLIRAGRDPQISWLQHLQRGLEYEFFLQGYVRRGRAVGPRVELYGNLSNLGVRHCAPGLAQVVPVVRGRGVVISVQSFPEAEGDWEYVVVQVDRASRAGVQQFRLLAPKGSELRARCADLIGKPVGVTGSLGDVQIPFGWARGTHTEIYLQAVEEACVVRRGSAAAPSHHALGSGACLSAAAEAVPRS